MANSGIIKGMDAALKGIKDWEDKLKEYDSKNVMIGVTSKTNGEGGNAMLMAVHEYGTEDGHIPERRPIRLTLDNNADKYARRYQQGLDKVLRGEMSADVALKSIGEEVSGDVKKTIMNGLTPPLADSTISRRINKSDKPLYDTGELLASITYEVRKK